MTDLRPDTAPVSDVDPFAPASLADPIPVDEALRELGPLVWLRKYDLWATGRHETVERIFRDPTVFESSAGTGLTNIKHEENWRPPSVILEADPPEHGKYRKVMTTVLSQRVIRRLKDEFRAHADDLVADLVGRGEFDAAKDLAEAFPLRVLPDAVGLAPEGREHLLTYANLNFQAMGPKNALYQEAVANAVDATQYVNWQMRRENLDEDKLAGSIFAAADKGDISAEDAGMLVRTFLSAGLDTTILGIGIAIKALADNETAWQALRADPSLARTVFEEGLRWYAPSPFIGRTTTCPVEIDGAFLGAAQKVLLLVGAANRDPRRWERPEQFDLARDTSGQLAFGTGIHGCVGQMMARMEAEVVLSALAERAGSVELAGPPAPKLSNWLRGYDSLPVRVTPKRG
ncbi:cytochrome P450 [Saccharomonospora sp. NPDC046836]|uniref:cytochrome P450 n=1 Tax=Saccharomonospora sp. NPDC046836 TaxID=3156921 RepID=UPI0033D4C34C